MESPDAEAAMKRSYALPVLLFAQRLATTLTLLIAGATTAAAQPALPDNASVREFYAFHIGTLAYIYGYPTVEMYKQMYNETHLVSANQPLYAPVNRFYRLDSLITPNKHANLRAPSGYLLYFGGWCDLSKEPVIVHNPDTGGRYYTMAIADLNLELMHLGRRTVGTKEHYHALVGPDWKGTLPGNVLPVQVSSNRVRILGRLMVRNDSELPKAKALQAQFWMSPLSEWRRGKPPIDGNKPARTQALDPMEKLEFFSYLNKALRTNPQRTEEIALMTQFDAIGVGPFSEFNIDKLDPAIKAGLERAIPEARKMITYASRSTITPVNGWMTSNKSGRYGFDYLRRAAKLVKGGVGSLPEESLYSTSLFDDHVEQFSGKHRYSMTFKKGELPPVKEFWTLSTYRAEDSRFEQNAISRYSINSFSPDLEYGTDGSLTIYFQRNPPAKGNNNWLPTPAGKFFILMRQYEPMEVMLQGNYRLPRVRRVE
jgi:hypothetical protein